MGEDIDNKFFALFHLSLAKEIYKSFPNCYNEKLSEIGKEIGLRLVDNFCAENDISEAIKNDEIENYIKLFFQMYFKKKIDIQNGMIHLNEVFEEYLGIEIFIAILNEVFKPLNTKINFYKSQDGVICFTICEF